MPVDTGFLSKLRRRLVVMQDDGTIGVAQPGQAVIGQAIGEATPGQDHVQVTLSRDIQDLNRAVMAARQQQDQQRAYQAYVAGQQAGEQLGQAMAEAYGTYVTNNTPGPYSYTTFSTYMAAGPYVTSYGTSNAQPAYSGTSWYGNPVGGIGDLIMPGMPNYPAVIYGQPAVHNTGLINPCPKCQCANTDLVVETTQLPGGKMAYAIRCPKCLHRAMSLNDFPELLKNWNESSTGDSSGTDGVSGEQLRRLDV